MTTVSPDSTMQELLQAYPGGQRALFRNFHIGGCSSCGFRPEETLAEVCERNDGLDPELVLRTISEGDAEDRRMLIEPGELFELMKEGPVRLLDLRTREEFDAVRMPDATHMTNERMNEALAEWPKDEWLILIDHQGTRCLDAASFFAGHGFTKVKGLRGGIDAWSLEIDRSLPRYTLE